MRSNSSTKIQYDAAKRLTPTTQNELAAFLAPLIDISSFIWGRIHFTILGLLGLYALSGLTIIEANEVGVILRLGEVIRSSGDPIIHEPGLVFALPRPFDEVIKIEADRIDTITIKELAPPSWQTVDDARSRSQTGAEYPEQQPLSEVSESIDPETYGYVLTGDRNILHTQIIARFRVSDPVDFALLTSSPTNSLRAALLQSTVKVAGETPLDDLLGSGRELFTRAVGTDAQLRLDRIGAGLEIISIEFESLSPPEQVAATFDAVQSAYIEAQTSRQDAQSYAAEVVPAAKANAKKIVADAKTSSVIMISTARAETDAFAVLLPAYNKNPNIVRHRLYREGVEQALEQVGHVRFVPSPLVDGYQGTRFSISSSSIPQSTQLSAEALETGPEIDDTNTDTLNLISTSLFPFVIGEERQ